MIQHVRALAQKYSHAELEKCIDQQIAEGKNSCFTGENQDKTVNVLSKASWVVKQVEDGNSSDVVAALRQLAASMRQVQQAE